MLAESPDLGISNHPRPISFSDSSPVTRSALRNSQAESILDLFESAARQTLDADLVRHIRQVIASKRRALPASR